MSRRYKTHIFIISVALMTLFVVGPPAAMASNLPTVCNIFSHKTTGKAEPCGHRTVFSKVQDKSLQVGAVLSFDVNFEAGNFLTIQGNPFSMSFPLGDNPQFNPLRC